MDLFTHLKDHLVALQEAGLAPRAGQVYRHYKGGHYKIVAVSIKEDTMTYLVTYRLLYDDLSCCVTRTLANFMESVTLESVTDPTKTVSSVRRFSYLADRMS